MPSGYTSDIYEGKDVSAKEFILKCARAFGATILMRDEPLDKEIPTFKPDKFYLSELEKVKQKLEIYKNMSVEEAQKMLDNSFEKEVESYHKRMKNNSELEERYRKVLNGVNQWSPPSDDHIKLKEYAINQLEESISFDCNQSYLNPPVKQDATEWLDLMINDTENKIVRYKQQWDEEVKRTNERNEWVKALKESL